MAHVHGFKSKFGKFRGEGLKFKQNWSEKTRESHVRKKSTARRARNERIPSKNFLCIVISAQSFATFERPRGLVPPTWKMVLDGRPQCETNVLAQQAELLSVRGLLASEPRSSDTCKMFTKILI